MWRSGLGVIVDSYLEEGRKGRGTLREAIELIGTHRVPKARNAGKIERTPVDDGPINQEDDEDSTGQTESEEDDFVIGGTKTGTSFNEGVEEGTSEGDSEEDDFVSINARNNMTEFHPLEVEKLKRSILRWRLGLGLDHARELKVAAACILKHFGDLFNILEPLADYWSFVLSKGNDISNQLISSWTGEFLANMLCIYVGATTDPQGTVTVIQSVGSLVGRENQEPVSLNEEKGETSKHLGGSFYRFTNLIGDTKNVREVLLPTFSYLFKDKRMQRATALSFCKPYLFSKENIERANYILSVPNSLYLPLDHKHEEGSVCSDDDHSDDPEGETRTKEVGQCDSSQTLLGFITLAKCLSIPDMTEDQLCVDHCATLMLLQHIYDCEPDNVDTGVPLKGLSSTSLEVMMSRRLGHAVAFALTPTWESGRVVKFEEHLIKETGRRQQIEDNIANIRQQLSHHQEESDLALSAMTRILLGKLGDPHTKKES